ncbi:MAG: RodZ domain-containing protein, partial [Pseudomonadota bacterium]|nr:RodZ domain-containing protein [Pseudomonadota bacterium]
LMSETVNDDFELGIGIALRDARVARNLSLAEVSALLRIREAHLEAIELEDFDQLPGDVYAIGFIRTYAQYLELNESDLIMRFKAASVESGMADLVFEEEEETEQISGALKISLLVVGALVVYVLWLVAGTQNDGITVSAVVQTPAAPVQAPAAPTQPAVVADEAAAASAAAAETPATPRAPDGAAPAAATIEGPADVQPNAQLIDTTPAPSKVEIRATRRTWMRLENAQGRVLFSSVIDEGEGFELPDDMDYILATRDAGALTYFVNNQAVAPVGRRGQILTNRNLKRADIAAQAQ